MDVQYISDKLGNKTAVVIPIEQWKKILQKYKGVEEEVEESFAEMSQEEFVQWIADAENSSVMSLETFNEKWEQEIQNIKSLIR
ncbi:hypothetical protein FFWV33_11560 [Flavobacterium faecale]|uniref:Prevent-host-death protein n=1 Tax=Flavobacterium faecale TaxID=1355330 RepID=A0A2S1LEK6_9FLAO|nr:hypothetical protein [Flavobacterium faecale]AWG22101.1 hypothetical protein FFWV33_11560 [Flavobacterium faecale]